MSDRDAVLLAELADLQDSEHLYRARGALLADKIKSQQKRIKALEAVLRELIVWDASFATCNCARCLTWQKAREVLEDQEPEWETGEG